MNQPEQVESSGSAVASKPSRYCDKLASLLSWARKWQQLYRTSFFNNPRYKWAQRAIWAAAILWAIVAGVQSIPYYTHIGSGKQAFQQGRYAEAERIFRSAVKDCEKFPHHDPRMANALNNLAELYRTQARYSEAEPLYKQAIEIAESLRLQHWGFPMSPNNVLALPTGMNNLAALYRDAGRYTEAEPLYKNALRIWQTEVKRPDDPNLAAILTGLGKLYRDQGKYTQAEPILQRALTIRAQRLGPDHPDFAITLGKQAEVFRAQKQFLASEKLYQRAQQILEKALGTKHPSVAANREGMIRLYRDMGKLDKANVLAKQAFAIKTRPLSRVKGSGILAP